jgi:hypothetical protein
MELEYILNELSVIPVKTIEEARKLMEEFIITSKAVRNIGFRRIRYANKSIKNIPLTEEGYIIENWLKDEDVNSDLRDAFRRNFTDVGSPYLEHDDTFFYHQDKEAKGLSMAYLKNTICISFQTDKVWNTNNIVLDVIDIDTEISQITFNRHVFDKDTAQKQQRIFENNPKHGWCGKGEHSGQSRMLCCDKEYAQLLLNIAHIQPNRESNFCNYDTDNERFIEFYSHEEGKYHGYHYEDERTKDADRKLNHSANGIPKETQEFLKEMHEKYYPRP